MLVAQSRPRDLDWHHSGPLLFGDWGTSRLYVLGLAFFYTAHASVWYLLAMSGIMAAVAWAYTIVCRSFPDGGGVYTSARQISPWLSVVGATLLLCDYIITAALSTIEAFHYFGLPERAVVPASMATIVLLGALNWHGARSAGRFALVIAVATMAASIVIACLCVPFIREGLRTVSLEGIRSSTNWERWESLVRIMLALSGVEAVSNMTGLMKQPVARTARRTIWPVLAEVVLLNIVFGLALAGLPALAATVTPDYATYVQHAAPSVQVPEEVREYRDTAMRVLAISAGERALGPGVGFVVGKIAAILFGLLLLSAANTVIVGMISVTYSLGRDREIPRAFTKLNYSGVPWVGVIVACVAPCAVLLFVSDVMLLAELYAVGVVGAITTNVLCCVFNRKLDISRRERGAMLAIGLFMLGVEVTIVATKPHAAAFAGGMVAFVLVMRAAIRARAPRAIPEPATGWMAALADARPVPAAGGPRIMLAVRAQDQAEYAVNLARQRGATLFAIYIRALRVMDPAPGAVARIEDDRDAQRALGTVAVLARRAGVPFVPIYVESPDIAPEILDYTVTFGCDTLIMGKTRRAMFTRAVAGDVVSRIAAHLPEGVSLITRAASSPFAPERDAPADGAPAAESAPPTHPPE